jgi:hypothetical protein
MRMSPANERATAPARRLPVLESCGREDDFDPKEEDDDDDEENGRCGVAAALCRMALSAVK